MSMETKSSEKSENDVKKEFDSCVVCGSENHDGKGWIFPTSDSKVVDITEDFELKRELKEDARPICSIECKDKFAESDDYTT